MKNKDAVTITVALKDGGYSLYETNVGEYELLMDHGALTVVLPHETCTYAPGVWYTCTAELDCVE